MLKNRKKKREKEERIEIEKPMETEATVENIRRFQENGYNVLVLGKARSGKSFATQQYWGACNDKSKSLWTLAHANRYRYVDRVNELTKTNNIYDSSVFAALTVDRQLAEREIIFIDELGLLGNLDLNESGIVRGWLSENKCVMTADVHQPVYTKTLSILLHAAFKYNSYVNALEKYNEYCLKDELKMNAYDVKKYETDDKFKIKILYGNYDANRPIVREFEKNGSQSFVVDAAKVDLSEEVNRGVKILTFSTETRNSLINDTITPNWLHNLKVGDTLFCHTNENVSRQNRRWWNGLY
jgi:hypothetical protein